MEKHFVTGDARKAWSSLNSMIGRETLKQHCLYRISVIQKLIKYFFFIVDLIKAHMQVDLTEWLAMLRLLFLLQKWRYNLLSFTCY